MRRFIWKMILKLMGWKSDVLFPPGIKKGIIIVAPHTCWQDLIIGLAYRSQFRLKRSKYLGKKELFDGPFGFIFRWSGGLPVDRFSKKNMVDQVVEIINKHEDMIIAISPEGTRKKVDRLKTGFYYIAKKAGIPIVMAGLDFTKKEVILAEPFYASDDEEKDFEHIIRFFAPIPGKYPELGLAHLLKEIPA